MKNLEPQLLRKRLIIEGYHSIEINEQLIKDYLLNLTKAIGMRPESDVFIFSPNEMGNPLHHGLNGFIAWVESGCHIYTWDTSTSPNFFTVDIYSCKNFLNEKAVNFTKNFFKATDLTFEEINPYE
jgi:S-adenosylmethionine decarboxylase